MLHALIEEIRELLELDVRPASAGVKPGIAPAKPPSSGGGGANTMVHTAHTLGLSNEKRQALIMKNAQKTAQRAAKAAAKTTKMLKKAPTAPAAPSAPAK